MCYKPVDEQEKERERYKKSPIYGTDFNKPVSQLIEDVRNTITDARGKLQDIVYGVGWEDRLDHIMGLLTCGLVALHASKEEIYEFEVKRDDHKNGPSLKFGSRGIGLDICPCCFVCGTKIRDDEAAARGNDYLHNIAAFVDTKEEGEKIVNMFVRGAYLDWRKSEPEWIQVKVGACTQHLPNLQKLNIITSYYNRIRLAHIEEARNFIG